MGGKVKDLRGTNVADDPRDLVRIRQVGVVQSYVAEDISDAPPCVRRPDQQMHLMAASKEASYKVRADEAGTPGDDGAPRPSYCSISRHRVQSYPVGSDNGAGRPRAPS